MKRVACLTALLLLGGCAHDTATHNEVAQAPSSVPAGMFKLLDTAEFATYFDTRSVALYQGNPHLRQFYLINNYLRPDAASDKLPEIRSSRAILVINCERDEMAQFGRVYFSQPFAQGYEVTGKSDIAQWGPLRRQSRIGALRDPVCKIDAAHLHAGNPG